MNEKSFACSSHQAAELYEFELFVDKLYGFIVVKETDETCPGPNPEVVIPDAGPIVAAIKCASGRDPLTVGKPCTPAFNYIKRKWNINPSRTMMIGDRTNTDVKFGRDHGMKTLLVLSGCHQIEDIIENQMNERDDMVPDYVAPCLGALVPETIQIYY
uniref:Phosphoglycolate phosphatase n=1 Tax=Caenorhabditis tropicalis TaxID=1561998 RepID=A0A1I7T7Z9_9PELO